MKMEVLDIIIVLICTAAMMIIMFLVFGCSSTCKKLCCPKEGHGPCPICTNVIYDSGDIIYGRKR